MDKAGILLLVPPHPGCIDRLLQLGLSVYQASNNDELRAIAAQHGEMIRAVFTSGFRGMSESEMATFSRLGLVSALGAGYENIDLAAARRHGITISHGRGVNDSSVADHAMALLLSIVRGIPDADATVRNGGWSTARTLRPSLSGKRLGILGMGNIGSGVAKRGHAGFDMPVGYHNRRQVEGSDYNYFASLVDLAAWADFLIVTCPGGQQTFHLVNADVLTALGPEGYIVNIARGSVIERAPLVDALVNRRIAGAALDVIEGEPIVPDQLLKLSNIVFTPHIGGRSPEAAEACWTLALQNLSNFLTGKPVLTPVL